MRLSLWLSLVLTMAVPAWNQELPPAGGPGGLSNPPSPSSGPTRNRSQVMGDDISSSTDQSAAPQTTPEEQQEFPERVEDQNPFQQGPYDREGNYRFWTREMREERESQ